MRTHRAAAAAAVLVFSALAVPPGCASDEPPAALPVYHVTKERNGETIRVARGQVVAAVLPSVTGSPNRWKPSVGDPAVLRQRGGREVIAPRAGTAFVGGAKGHDRFEFDTLRTGVSTLRLTRQRADRDGGGSDVFEVTVEVVGAAAAPVR